MNGARCVGRPSLGFSALAAPLALVALVALEACQTRGSLEQPLALSDPRISACLDGLAQAAATRGAMRAQARLALDAPDLRFRRPQRLVVARPNSLRVEVLGLFGQVAAILVTEDGRYQFFDPAQGVMEEGEIAAELLWRLARVDLMPEEAVGVLLGAPAPDPGSAPIAASRTADGRVAVLLADGSTSARRRFEFDELGRLRSAKRFTADGEAIWSARFDDYREVGDEVFAFRVALSFPRVDAKAEIEFKQVELPAELPRDVFQLSLPRAKP